MGSITDQVGNVDTTGVAPGPHADIKGVSIAFEAESERLAELEEDRNLADRYDPAGDDERKQRDKLSLDERLSAKAVAAGTDAEQTQQAPLVGEWEREPPKSDYPYSEESPDTTETDTVSASARGKENVIAHQTDTIETSETGGGPNIHPDNPGVMSASSLEGSDSATAVASDPSNDFEHPNDVRGPETRPVEDKFWDMTVADLRKLANKNDVGVAAGALKQDIIDQLMDYGVKPPTS